MPHTSFATCYLLKNNQQWGSVSFNQKQLLNASEMIGYNLLHIQMQGISPKAVKHMSTTSDDCEMRDIISLQSKSSADHSDLNNAKIQAIQVLHAEMEAKESQLKTALMALMQQTDEAKKNKEAALQTGGSISDGHQHMEDVDFGSDSDLEMDMCVSTKIQFQEEVIQEELLISTHQPILEKPQPAVADKSVALSKTTLAWNAAVMPCCRKRAAAQKSSKSEYKSPQPVHEKRSSTPKKLKTPEKEKTPLKDEVVAQGKQLDRTPPDSPKGSRRYVMPCLKKNPLLEKHLIEDIKAKAKVSQEKSSENLKIFAQKSPENVNIFTQKEVQEKPRVSPEADKKKDLMPCLKKNLVLEKHLLEEMKAKAKMSQEKSLEKQKKEADKQLQDSIRALKAEVIPERCQGGNPIKKVCIEHKCGSDAFLCNSKACTQCKESHGSCKLTLTSQVFLSAINDNFDRQLTVQQTVYECEERFIQQIRKNRAKRAKLAYFQGVKPAMMEKLEERHAKKWQLSIKSNEILEIIQAISEEEPVSQMRELNLVEKLTSQQKVISDMLQDQMKVVLEKTELTSPRILKSALVTSHEDIRFVLEQLDCPRKLNLFYRASEHEFSISKFHRMCDHLSKTLTIYKTEHGRLIGGYTPVSWANKYGRDRDNKSFMMNITLRERLEHKSHGESAIYCKPEFGPSFGGFFEQRDLEIRQQGGVLFCSTNFPSAYNWKQFFKPGQESYRFLTGVEKGQQCRILDMEVYEVVPRQ